MCDGEGCVQRDAEGAPLCAEIATVALRGVSMCNCSELQVVSVVECAIISPLTYNRKAMYINKVFLYGNLGRDPELRALPNGSQVVSFSMATTRIYKDKDGAKKEQTDWHNIVIFGRQAEIANQYLKKGRPVFIEGRLQTRSWEQDGQKRYRTEVIVDRFQFGPSAAPSGAPAGGEGAPTAEPAPNDAGAIEYPQEDINPDDIPF